MENLEKLLKVKVNRGDGMENDGAIYPIKFVRIDKPDGLYDGGIIWQLVTNSSWEIHIYRQLFSESFEHFLCRNCLEIINEEV